MRLFAMEATHPLILHWIPLRSEIEAALEQSPITWSALELYRHQLSILNDPEDRDATTVVITARCKNDSHWAELEDTVRRICRTHGQNKLQVELIPGVVERFGLPAEPSSHRLDPIIDSNIELSSNDWSSGTLGGYPISILRM